MLIASRAPLQLFFMVRFERTRFLCFALFESTLSLLFPKDNLTTWRICCFHFWFFLKLLQSGLHVHLDDKLAHRVAGVFWLTNTSLLFGWFQCFDYCVQKCNFHMSYIFGFIQFYSIEYLLHDFLQIWGDSIHFLL